MPELEEEERAAVAAAVAVALPGARLLRVRREASPAPRGPSVWALAGRLEVAAGRRAFPQRLRR